MYTIPPKKLLIINILDILKKYTDANHRLSQRQIMDILADEYNMTVDRKTVKRNLMNLLEFGYDIEFTETVRVNKKGENEMLYSDWYLERDFSDAELRLLVDGLLFSKHIPYSQCKALIEKLETLSNNYFKFKVKHIRNLPENMPENKQLFYIIETLDEAISHEKQVEFTHNEYGTDKKLHPRYSEDGKVRRYVINPYQMAATNGRYYLICNYDKYDDVSHYRLDRITNIKLLETPVKPKSKVLGLTNGLDLPQHMAEHIYMFSGPSEEVTFKARKDIITEIIDWFGKDVEFSNETPEIVTAKVKVNLQSMHYWILQHAPSVKVLSPKSLVEQVKQDIREAVERYGKEG